MSQETKKSYLPSQFDGEFHGVGMGKIFIKTNLGDTNVLDIRGWGYLTGKGCCALGLKDEVAGMLQEGFEQWVIDALNYYRKSNLSESINPKDSE